MVIRVKELHILKTGILLFILGILNEYFSDGLELALLP